MQNYTSVCISTVQVQMSIAEFQVLQIDPLLMGQLCTSFGRFS